LSRVGDAALLGGPDRNLAVHTTAIFSMIGAGPKAK
jgi:hypothetical protein